MYTGDIMKKSEFITFRTDPKTKQILEQKAAQQKWTISFLVEDIIAQWLQAQEDAELSNQQ